MKKLYVFGTGRWAQESLESAIKFKNTSFYVISKKKHILKWAKKNKIKNIIFLKNLPRNKKNLESSVLVISKVKKHFKQIKDAIKKKYSRIFVEKPIVEKDYQVNYLEKHKKKIFVSRIFSFDKKLSNLLGSLKKEKIISISFKWHDQVKEIRRKKIKKHDKSIKFLLDVMPHIINFLDLIFDHRLPKPKNFKIRYNKKNESFFEFKIKNINVNCDLSRISNRSRLIKINFIDKKYVFDLTNNNKYILKKYNSKKNNLKIFNIKADNLKKMLFAFIFSTDKIKYLNYKYSKKIYKDYSKVLY